jgi:phosphoribosylanthranilate isomerase
LPTPLVKICGITLLEDARYCAGAGADFLGFIQYESSPRYIPPAKAREIIDWVYGPKPVGVFVNATADEVNEAVEAAGFAFAQLHGHETPETCAAIGVPVIKAFSVTHDASAEQLLAIMEPYRGVVDYFLLDTHHTSLYGGTGESFNWRLARELSDAVPLFLAGGLSESNVAEAVQTIRPYALDLSSSVEREPGVKDFDKLGRFFDAFRDAVDQP